jgi:hypothetical protein
MGGWLYERELPTKMIEKRRGLHYRGHRIGSGIKQRDAVCVIELE